MKHMLEYYTVKDAPQKEIEKVIQGLPKLYKKQSLLSMLKLQAFITPKYYYVLLVLLTTLTITQLNPYAFASNFYFNGNGYYMTILFYLIAIISLTIPEINRSHMYQMEEMERSCRYHYVHLLFQRISLFSLLILMISAVISIWSAYIYSTSLLTLCCIIFTPILIIMQITLIIYKVANIKETLSRIITFISVSAICMILLVPFIMRNQTIVNLILIIIFMITLHYYIKKLLKEAKNNETFSIESE